MTSTKTRPWKFIFFILAVGFAGLSELIFLNPDLSAIGRFKRCLIMQVFSLVLTVTALWFARKSSWWQKAMCETLFIVVAFEFYVKITGYTDLVDSSF